MRETTLSGPVTPPQEGYRGCSVAILRFAAAWMIVFPLLTVPIFMAHAPYWYSMLAVLSAALFFYIVCMNRPANIVELRDDAMILGVLGGKRTLRVDEIAYVSRSRRQDLGIPFQVYIATVRGSGVARRRYVCVADGRRVFVDWAAKRGIRVLNDSRSHRTSAST